MNRAPLGWDVRFARKTQSLKQKGIIPLHRTFAELQWLGSMLKFTCMSTLVEIEAAADSLPSEQKQELFLFLAARLRGTGQLPPVREFSREQIESWIADDESGMRRFRESQ